MILAIDFDDVIHDTKNRPPGKVMGLPVDQAKEALQAILSDGHEIIIYSQRLQTAAGLKSLTDWLRDHGFDGPYQFSAYKPACDWYIDNKAIHFDNWKSVLGYLRVPANAN